jgi:ATP-dependent Lon protease
MSDQKLKAVPKGMYRVLPNLAGLAREMMNSGSNDRSADVDVNGRRSRVIHRLQRKGPDRLIGYPVDWQDAADSLESAVPHFKSPIRFIRNIWALAEVHRDPIGIPPILLVGDPGIGKSYFADLLAAALGTAQGRIDFDNPSGGSQLRGSDKYWSNSSSGLLFNLICEGDYANPVVLLEEVDKSGLASNRDQQHPLVQLHSVLEPQTARRLVDVSLDIEFDASLVTYIATANTLNGLEAPLRSRFEIFHVSPPTPVQAYEIASQIVAATLARLKPDHGIAFDRTALQVLAQLTPRLIRRLAFSAAASAKVNGIRSIQADHILGHLSGAEPAWTH